MTDEQIEAAARALSEYYGIDPDEPWPENEPGWKAHVHFAVVALEAAEAAAPALIRAAQEKGDEENKET